MENKYDKYLKMIKKANTETEIKEIIKMATNDNTFEDRDYDMFIYEIAPIIESKLKIKIDNYENTDSGLYQKIIDLEF